MVAPAGDLLLLLRLAAFIFSLVFFLCFSLVIGSSTPASSLKMTHIRNKGENDKKIVKFVQRFTVKTVYSITEHVGGNCLITLPTRRGK